MDPSCLEACNERTKRTLWLVAAAKVVVCCFLVVRVAGSENGHCEIIGN